MIPINSRVIISGAGFLADAYDLFVINIVVDLMAQCEYSQELTIGMKSTIKSMALLGAMLGQIGFGALADHLGRKRIFIATCVLVLFGALMSACVIDTSGFGIFSQLCFWRFWLGVGVGGEYPLSASVTVESSSPSNQITNLASVFAMQGVGTILCAIVLVIVTSIDTLSVDSQWRIALAFGGLPMLMAFYFRFTMHETLTNTTGNKPASEAQATSWTNRWKVLRENATSLCGTAGCWFLLDVVFYANGLFSGQVTGLLHIVSSVPGEALAALILNVSHYLHCLYCYVMLCYMWLYVQCIAFPGYLLSIRCLSPCGVKPVQIGGFLLTATLFFSLSAFQPYLVTHPALYLLVYGLSFLAQNFGPNATTYILPSVLFRPAIRGTCHGLSSAAGKLGAVLGSQVFLLVARAFCSSDSSSDSDGECGQENERLGMQLVFLLCGLVSLLGAGWTVYFIPDHPALYGPFLSHHSHTIEVEDLEDDEEGDNNAHNKKKLQELDDNDNDIDDEGDENDTNTNNNNNRDKDGLMSISFFQPHHHHHPSNHNYHNYRYHTATNGVVVDDEDLHL